MPRTREERVEALERALPEAVLEAVRETEMIVMEDAPSRSAIERSLESLGCPSNAPVVDLLALLSGLELGWLKVGLSVAARDHHSPASRRLAAPVATAPDDVTFWIDAEGVVYDDTDLERCVPIGRGAAGLLDYWLIQSQGRRWSGVVHDYCGRIGDVSQAEVLRALALSGERFAIGEALSVWPPHTLAVCDTLNQARTVFEKSAALSCNDRGRWIQALSTIADTYPDFAIRLDFYLPPEQVRPSEEVIHRLRCFDMYREEKDGVLCIIRSGDGELGLRLHRDA